MESTTETLSVVNHTKKSVLPNFLRSSRVSMNTQKPEGLSRKYICKHSSFLLNLSSKDLTQTLIQKGLDCKDGRKLRFSFPSENLASLKGEEGEKVNESDIKLEMSESAGLVFMAMALI